MAQWLATFHGMAAGDDLTEQVNYGQNLLSVLPATDLQVISALDLTGTFIVESPTLTTESATAAVLSGVPGFVFVEAYTPNPNYVPRLMPPARARSEAVYGPFDLDAFLIREKNGEFPNGGGDVDSPATDVLTNNNTGGTGTSQFTQSENSLVAFGNTVILGFNDSGSNAGGSNKFTGYSRSTDGGVTFTDGGTLPTNTNGDAGDPVLARNDTTGRIYFSTLQWSGDGLRVFRSDDNGATWLAPVQGAPGKTGFQDKQWLAVDNFAGPGNGNVYHIARDFGSGDGIYLFRSTDHGATFGPSGGTLIASGAANNVQGAFVTVGPDHSVYAFYFDENSTPERIMMRRSTDQGVSFGAPVTVATLATSSGFNGDLGLVGQNNGESTNRTIRSNAFPHAVVNPISGHVYVTFNDNPAGTDKADVFVAVSSNNGATWGSPIRVNDDATTNDQWQPTLAVATDGSKLGVFYYSRQEDTGTLDGDPANNQFRYYGRIANIVGPALSFQPSFAISDQPSKPEVARDSLINTTYMGDYDQAVSTPGAFHVVWADNTVTLPSGGGRMDPNVFYEKIQLGLAVTTTTPAANSVVSVAPTVFTVNVTDPVNPGTVNAADLTVNGIPANSVVYVPGSTTLTFTYLVSPVTVEGLQTMQIVAGAFTRASDGDPLALFDATFRYDVLTLQVVATTPPFPSGVFTLPGSFTYDVTFNEPIAPASLQTSDLLLSGIGGAFVSGVTLLAGNTTARFTIAGILTEGALTANILGGAVTDGFGNSGLSFNATYQVDYGTFPFPTPLNSTTPLGSLIYSRTLSGLVNTVGDVDNFTLDVDSNQTISVIVTPTAPGLQPSVQLLDPSSGTLGIASAGAAGQIAGMQTIPASVAGVYTFAVSGVGSTVGAYSLQVILNSAFELEGNVAGAVNNTAATAQDISASVISLGPTLPPAGRGAVLGETDPAGGYSVMAQTFGFTDISATGATILQNVDDSTTTVALPFTFSFYGTNYTQLFPSSNGLITFGNANSTFSNATLASNPAQAAIAVFWDDLYLFNSTSNATLKSQVIGSVGNRQLILQWDKINFFSSTGSDTLTFQAILSEGTNTIRLNYLDLAVSGEPRSEGTSATVGIKAANPAGTNFMDIANPGPNALVGTGKSLLISPTVAGDDWYRITLAAGERVSLAATNLATGNVDVQLRDPAGTTVLASGTAGATNVNEAISNFLVTSAGTYTVRVSGDSNVPYSLVVTKEAAFELENNNTLALAQDLSGTAGVLGFTQGANPDWYRVTLSGGEVGFKVQSQTPADGAGQFSNLLNPQIRIFDSLGVDITPAVTILADGRNEQVEVKNLSSGATYYVQITSESSTQGEYVVGLEMIVGTLTAVLNSGVLTVEDISATGRDNRFTVRVVNGGADLEISDAQEAFFSIPPGGVLSNQSRTLSIPLAGLTSLVVNGMAGDDTYVLEALGLLPHVLLDGGTGIDQFGTATQNITPALFTSISISGGNPLVATSGDTFWLDVSSTTDPTVTIPGSAAPFSGLGSGTWNFASGHQPIEFGSVEQNTIAGAHRAIVDNNVSPVANLVVMRDSALPAANLQLRDGSTAGPIIYQGTLATLQSLQVLGTAGDDMVTIDDTNGLPNMGGTVPGVADNGNLTGTAALLFDGFGGQDTLTFRITGSAASQSYAIGNGSGASAEGEIYTASSGLTLIAYFQNVELAQRTGQGPAASDLKVLGDASDNSIQTTASGFATRIVAAGYTPFEFSGNNYSELTIDALGGLDSIDLINFGTDQTNHPTIQLFGGAADDTLRVRSTSGNSGLVSLHGGAGNDLFELYDDGFTVNNIAGPVDVDGFDGNVGGNLDTLTVIDRGDTDSDNVVFAPLNPSVSPDYYLNGINTAGGNDVVLRNIDTVNYTGTAADDEIDVRLQNTIPLHDLSMVTFSGWTGADLFLLFISDQFGGSGPTPNGMASGIASVGLYGDAPGNPNAGDGRDNFGMPPSPISGTGAMDVGLAVPDTTRLIRPSATTSITIDGGRPTGLSLPVGDIVGDALNLDIGGLPNTTPVIVSTSSPGTLVTNLIQPLTWTEIEDMNLADQQKLTNMQMGDLFARTTPGPDLVQITQDPTLQNPNQLRLRISATIGNYSATNKTVVYGGAGNDSLTQANLTIPAEFYGEAGDDYLTGAMNNDWLVGGLGSDRINGSGGDNVIWGDNAPTIPTDETPQDQALGGNDTLSAAGGADVFYGGGGNDTVSAGAGNDYAYGGQGNDTLDGNDGDDRLYGGLGNDVLSGHSGHDLLSGGEDDDRLFGATGNDVLIGGNGADLVSGGEGDDLLIGGSVVNETSIWTSLGGTASYSAATYTDPSGNDASLLILLAQWASANDRTTLAAVVHDGANDDLFGDIGDDDFAWELADVVENFPGTAPPDFNAPLMGTDGRFGPT